MGFISTTFDVRKFARNLDRTPSDLGFRTRDRWGNEKASVKDLSEYVQNLLFIPMLVQGEIPISKIDFNLISDDDVEKLREVFENGKACRLFEVCSLFDNFSPTPTNRKLLI